ncbi:type III restriction-modification system endonuclease [Clostridium taeniosporum]|uniref:Restriction endonuclease subunit R n=1 Tax=Clostridium taeniosporum TaxID=394958 RepID=A0A1D7XP18_9CLOT|nr:DEAD/DEAH box helicase family protein [Clostridium taeniosporum]AOR25054.1 restriction endonuclease subunit R [Clostridium taeniosporum]
MKFKFKIQDYQTKAVENVINVFKGQPFNDHVKYTRDLGIREKKNIIKYKDAEGNEKVVEKGSLFNVIDSEIKSKEIIEDYYNDIENSDGFENADLLLDDGEILKNIKNIQSMNNINLSNKLVKHLGRCSLDVEMETGTGKTYVYIKTIFELNKKYGFSKFIIVVPSIAIREGVKKTFEITEEHFMDNYHKKARYFVYDSKHLNNLDNFSKDSNINVMIINAQAFNARGKDARRIYEKLDEFQSRKPIDVISANRPILIMDEPQKLSGKATQESLKLFKPLFCLNYSATHKDQHNLVYVLDALDAYNERLVKKIEVKGFEVKNFRGTEKYLYLDEIIVSAKKPPRAKVELEIKYNKSINRESRVFAEGDNLYVTSNNMEQYKENFVINEINPINGSVTFTNGLVITKGEIVGDISEKDLRRIQIRETIASHFEKEEVLFNKGIKTLSLFFIDEVAKYRVYDENGEEQNSEYAQIFEEEYTNILNEYITLLDTPYVKYLKNINVKNTHKGYFSIDKKTKRIVDSVVKGKSTESDDITAYDLILKNKERLLSFEEPTRFIFSHSALREGWDNPNVFQICTLKHSDSTTQKRQEVGRGLRLCVDKNGNRVDLNYPGIEKNNIHNINKLTVIASESYKIFAEGLQKDIKANLYDRPKKATIEYFEGKKILINDEIIEINKKQAKEIYRYLIKNDYIDNDENINENYRTDLENHCIAKLPEALSLIEDEVQKLIQSVFDETAINNMMENANSTKVKDNELNNNFYKKEFQTLWNYINHKYVYTVQFESEELIKKSIEHINKKMFVSQLQYTLSKSEQKDNIDINELERGESFKNASSSTKILNHSEVSRIKYDLVGKVAEGTTLTRKSIVKILKGIEPNIFSMFKNNPEEFITKCIRLIKEQKATMIVNHITYNQIQGTYDSDIFTADDKGKNYSKAFLAKKHIKDYVFTDGTAEKSIERKFAEDIDDAYEVSVYAKLPRTFQIPTPVGNYSPDWAISFKEGSVKHIFFIAETKGTMESMNLREIEKAKISCAKKLFNELSTSNVKYHEVDSYQELLNVMNSL